jgi:hypothetical protein
VAGSSPEGDGPGRVDAASALPTPYLDPWRLLRRDLRAVAASTRLRLQELARLNREGQLPRPGFWPASWAAWFWPLVLTAALGSLLALAALLMPALPWSRPAAIAPAEPTVVVEGLDTAGDGAASPNGSPQSEPLPPSRPPSASPAPSVPPPGGLSQSPEPEAPESAPLAVEDPLLEAFQAAIPGREDLVLKLEPAVAARLPLLQLLLGPAWPELAAAEQQQLADRWLLMSRQLDYDALELRDPEGRLLARSARVGSGMILLSAP